MSFNVTPHDVKLTSAVELAFSTTRLLPDYNDIPDDFKRGNIYTETVEAIFFDSEPPNTTISLKLDVTIEELKKCILAHLRSFEPKHEHKMAGVGFLFSKIATLQLNASAV